jgi:hypothetical protein
LSGIVRRLRAPYVQGSFETKLARLNDYERAQVKLVVNGLRTAPELPGDDDVDDIRPPCMPVLRRAVPNTALWVYYEASEDTVYLWSVKTLPVPDPAVIAELLASRDEDFPPESQD